MLITTPKQAELNAAEVLRSWGYVDAVSPMHGADGGIDVRSSQALAQVKFRSVKAGRPEIQNLWGAAAGEMPKALLFFDFKGYSPQAVEYANQMGISLYVYDQTGKVTPVNDAARRLMTVSTGAKILALVMSQQFRWIGTVVVGVVLALVLIGLALPGTGWNRMR
ncbi:restriction endonuclease [Mycolicibacterium wolinskyi]|uniref:restriction endonuclease n=1 Tax=Mycolicibacterium wolinskyi TaxID=59750 RepID=UPI003917A57B